MIVKDGQHRAFEVTRVTKPYQNTTSPAEHQHVATVWNEDDAHMLASFANSKEVRNDPYNGKTVREIGVIVVGDEAFYDTAKDPVSTSLIFDTAGAAASFAEFSEL